MRRMPVAAVVLVSLLAGGLVAAACSSGTSASQQQSGAERQTVKQLSAWPTQSIPALTQDLLRVQKRLGGVEDAFGKVGPTNPAFNRLRGEIAGLGKMQGVFTDDLLHMKANLTALESATHASASTIEQAASSIGVKLDQALTTHSVQDMINAIP